jgi:hypothetical protein
MLYLDEQTLDLGVNRFLLPSSARYDGSVSTSGRQRAILRVWQSSQVYVRKMPRASHWGDRLLEPQEHGFWHVCVGIHVIFLLFSHQAKPAEAGMPIARDDHMVVD